MKFKHYIVAGLTALSFGMIVDTSPASAKTYRSVPHAIKGYYISKSAHEALAISKKHVIEAYPWADAYSYRVTRVKRSGHKYHIRGYMRMGGKYYATFKIKKHAHHRITAGRYSFKKVSKHSYYKFLNSWKYVRG